MSHPPDSTGTARAAALGRAVRAFVWEAAVEDGELRYTYADEATAAVLGLEPGAWLRDGGRALVHEADADAVLAARLLAARGQAYAREYRARCPDGLPVWLRESAEPLAGVPGGVRGVTVNVTAEVEARAVACAHAVECGALLEGAPDATVIIDPEGRVLQANRRALELFGARDAAGVRVGEWLNGEELRRASDGRVTARERSIQRPDGDPVRVEVNAGPMGDGRVQATVRDVTVRRAAAGEAAMVARRLRALFDSDPVPAYVWELRDDTFVLDDLNGAARQQAGLPADELLGREAPDLFAEHPGLPALLRRCATRRETVRSETDFVDRATGRRGRMLAACSFVPPDRVALKLEDVSEQRALEEALRRRDLTFQAISDAVFLADREGRIADWNPAAERMFGRTRAEVLGRLASVVHGTRVMERFGGELLERLSGEDRWAGEVPFMRPDGSHGVAEATVVALRDYDGALVGMIAVERDITERRRAEEALRDSEARFRGVFQNSGIGICLTSPEMRVLDTNPAFARMLGTTVQQLRGRTLAEFSEAADVAENTALFERMLAGDLDHYALEKRYRRVDGGRLWVRLTASAVRDSSGALLYQATMIEDVSAGRRAMDALRESEQRFRALIQHSTDIFTVLDSDYTVRDISPSVQAVMGYEAHSVVGTNALDYLHPDDRAGLRATLEWCGRHPGEPCPTDYRILRADGQYRVHEAVATSLLRVAALRGLVINSRDVTERRRHEDESRRLAALVHAASDAVLAKGLDGVLQSWNPAAERMMGWTEAEMVGTSVLRVIPPEFQQAEMDMLARVARGEMVPHYETERIRKDGSRVRVSITLSPVNDAEGRTTVASCIVRDVTQQRKLEEQLRAAQKMEAVGRLAGGVAHDFNNLLTAIKGNAALLLADLPSGDPMRVDVAEIDRAADRAADLTRQLLAFSRRQVLQPRVLDLNAVVRDMQRMLRRLIEEDVALDVSLAPAVGPVRADPGQVEQVLVNLVVNARDATPAGGRIALRTMDVDVDGAGNRAGVPYYVAAGPYVRMEVQDTGTGIDPHTLSQIFEPFFTTKPAGKGTGLGLSTAYGIVKQSGGYVWAESEPGRGSTFVVLLPRVTGEVEADAVAPALPEPAAATGTVLLVEDEPSVRTLARRTLERAGYRVLEAQSLADALEAAKAAGTIDLLLTDVIMPGGSGAAVATQLSAIHPGLRVVFMSGYAGEAVAEHGLPPDVDLIDKPFSPAELVRRLAEALARPRG